TARILPPSPPPHPIFPTRNPVPKAAPAGAWGTLAPGRPARLRGPETLKGVTMRATAMVLAAAVLLSAGSLAHADPWMGYRPPAGCDRCNPGFYTSNGCCWWGPNYCFRGPCLPPSPFNGVLPLPKEYAHGMHPAYAPPAAQPPCPPGFVTHPFARSPRDF